MDCLDATTAKYPDDPLLKAGALNLTLDAGSGAASVATGTAPVSTLEDGLPFDADTLNRLVRRLDARGWQIVTDAATERAVRMAVDAYQHAVRSNPGRTAERRHRIQHLGSVAPDDLPRFAPLDIVASMRPGAERTADKKAGEPVSRGLASVARRIATAGGRLAFGSGWPAASLNPLLGLSAVVSPSVADDGDDRARLSLKAAIDAYTSGAAWASFDDQRKGTIAPGMLADLVVLSEDIFKSAPSDLPAARVEVTIFDGTVVYRRSQHATN